VKWRALNFRAVTVRESVHFLGLPVFLRELLWNRIAQDLVTARLTLSFSTRPGA
jgi:hypothetical protein